MSDSMRTCDKCGAKLPAGTVVCPGCGAYSRPVRQPGPGVGLPARPVSELLPQRPTLPRELPPPPAPPKPDPIPPAPPQPPKAPQTDRSPADRLLAGTVVAVVLCCLLLVTGSGVYLYAAGEQGRLERAAAAEREQAGLLTSQRVRLEREVAGYQEQLAQLEEELASLTDAVAVLEEEAAPFDASDRVYDLPEELQQRRQELEQEGETLLSQLYRAVHGQADYFTQSGLEEALPSPYNGLFAGRAEARDAFRTLMTLPGVRRDILARPQQAEEVNRLPGAALATVAELAVQRCSLLAEVTGPEQLTERNAAEYATAFLELCQTYGYLNRLCDGAAGLSLTEKSPVYSRVEELSAQYQANRQLIALYQQMEP